MIFPTFSPSFPNDFSVLGLGDITLPGLMISLALELDILNSNLLTPVELDSDIESKRVAVNSNNKRNLLFQFAMIGYVFGLMCAFIANRISNHPQPALLYIVPSVVTCLLGRAYAEGRLIEVWYGKKKGSEERE